MSKFDEFGNLLDGEEDEEEEYEEEYVRAHHHMQVQEYTTAAEDRTHEEEGATAMETEGSRAVVLHEDKEYYATAAETYPGAATVLLEEDAQPLEEPLLKPTKTRTFSALESRPPKKRYSEAFLRGLTTTPEVIRNVAVVGALHSGKTLLMDCLAEACHENFGTSETDGFDKKEATTLEGDEVKYCDTRIDERERCMSIKSTPYSAVLQDSRGKHWLVNALDCPGHANLADEAACCMAAADGVVLVIDAVEGITRSAERLIARAVEELLPIVLVANKVDRLFVELKLPPTDAYFKLCHVVDECNAALEEAWAASASRRAEAGGSTLQDDTTCRLFDPRKGNVAFASAQHGWCFTLETLARVYADHSKYSAQASQKQPPPIDVTAFAKRLWGDRYFDRRTRTFVKRPPPAQKSSGGRQERGEEDESDDDDDPLTSGPRRSFVEFALEPLYKIYAQVLGEEPARLNATLKRLDVRLTTEELRLDPKPLLKVAFSKFFKHRTASALADLVSRHVPSPKDNAALKLRRHLAPRNDDDDDDGPNRAAYEAAVACSGDGPLLAHCVKLYSTPDAKNFLTLARVYSGTLAPGARVSVLGEAYSTDDTEDSRPACVANVAIPHGRHATDVPEAGPGNVVLLAGVDAGIAKTATLADARLDAPSCYFAPPRFRGDEAVVKLAVEPFHPAELPKMTEGLRKIAKAYPAARTKVEASGEHVIYGSGELYLDCVMRDLREMYSGVEIKVADPVVAFCETVAETSSLKCFAETPNKRNKLTLIAEPLDPGLSDAVDSGDLDPSWPPKKLATFMQTHYDWDRLAARGVWAFGPDPVPRAGGPGSSNLLLDDTLPSEVDKRLLNLSKDAVVQGFQWACREGPLCDEPVRNCKFKLLDAALADAPLHRGSGQIIPTARRVCYSAFLMAAPRLMEPIFAVDIHCPADCVSAVYPVLARRRGHVVHDSPKPGAPFYVVQAFLPAVDSFGFETDLRAYTSGQAMCSLAFDHWAVCPGDPLDRSIVLHPLEPSPPPHLAREFMVKTRRRKGLSEDTSIAKYFDDPLLRELAAQARLGQPSTSSLPIDHS